MHELVLCHNLVAAKEPLDYRNDCNSGNDAHDEGFKCKIVAGGQNKKSCNSVVIEKGIDDIIYDLYQELGL